MRETVGRVRRAGASGLLTLRCDSGFFSKYLVLACRDHDVRYSITVRQTPVIQRAFELIAEESWTPIDYTMNGEAWVGETDYQGQRLIVRRTKLHEPRPALFPDYRYHAFVTDRDGDAVTLDVDHRRHAVVELAIRDLKGGSGLEHCPSGDFNANAAWAGLASIAHNLVRWVAALGLKCHRTPRRQDSPSQVHHGARSSHQSLARSSVAPADELALGRAVESVLRASRQTADLTEPAVRPPADYPATSSANQLHTSPKP